MRTFSLDEELHDQLRILAWALGISRGDLIRYFLRTGIKEPMESLKTLQKAEEGTYVVERHRIQYELDDQLRGLAFALRIPRGDLVQHLLRTGLKEPMKALKEVQKNRKKDTERSQEAMQKLQKIREDAKDRVSELIKQGIKEDVDKILKDLPD